MESDEDELEKHELPFLSSQKKRRFAVQPEMKIWLISFTDVMALMLTFFVLIFSMISPERDMMAQIASVFKQQSQAGDFGDAGRFSTQEQQRKKRLTGDDLGYLASVLKERAKNNPVLQGLEIMGTEKQILIKLPQELLFSPGSYEVTEDVRPALTDFFGLLTRLQNRIEIQGYTDPAPVTRERPQYKSNWGLALQRSASVGRMVYEAGYRRQVALLGVANTGKADNERDDYAPLRRVEITIHEYRDGLF